MDKWVARWVSGWMDRDWKGERKVGCIIGKQDHST